MQRLLFIINLFDLVFCGFPAGVDSSSESSGAGQLHGEENPSIPVVPKVPYANTPGSGSTHSGSSGGITSSELEENLGDALEKLSELLKEIVPDLIDAGSNTSNITTASLHQSSPTVGGTSQHASALTTSTPSPAKGCISAQSVYSDCSIAWISASDVVGKINNAAQKGDFVAAPLSDQASCLCYTSGANASTPLWAATRFDGFLAQCNDYLISASLPATTTVSDNTATITPSALQAPLSSAQSQCGKVGDVRAIATRTSTTVPMFSPVNAADRELRPVAKQPLALVILVMYTVCLM